VTSRTHANWLERYWLWLVGGAAVAAGGVYYFATKPAPQTPLLPGAGLITLVPNRGPASQTARLGDAIVIALPLGATWISNNGAPLTGAAPITWKYSGPGVVTLVWSEFSGTTQTSQLTFSTVQ
jgi:hypothetical protein